MLNSKETHKDMVQVLALINRSHLKAFVHALRYMDSHLEHQAKPEISQSICGKSITTPTWIKEFRQTVLHLFLSQVASARRWQMHVQTRIVKHDLHWSLPCWCQSVLPPLYCLWVQFGSGGGNKPWSPTRFTNKNFFFKNQVKLIDFSQRHNFNIYKIYQCPLWNKQKLEKHE